MLTKKSSVTSQASDLFNKMNIDIEQSEAETHAEFNSRLTYLSFKDEKEDATGYHEMMIKTLGHRSIFNDEIVTFLIAGCSIETLIEFMAHNEATIARLTSSKTKSQNKPLYRLRTKGFSEDFINLQMNMITQNELMREKYESMIDSTNAEESEIFNIQTLGSKAVSFTITMSIKDWHKTLIGRLSNHGVESEMIEILNDITDLLNVEYPNFFESKEAYYAMGQSVMFFKYEKTEISDYFVCLILEELKSKKVFTEERIGRIRSLFTLYLNKLQKNNVISIVEKEYYNDIFPIFKTFFVFYDSQLSYKSIDDVVFRLIDI